MASNWKRSGLLYITILLAGVAMVTILFSAPQKPAEVPLSEVTVMSQSGQIEQIAVEGEWLTIITTDGEELKSFKGNTSIFEITGLNLEGIEFDIRPGGIDWGSMLIGFLPLLLFGGLLFFIFFRA